MFILKSWMVGLVMLIIVSRVQGNEIIYSNNFTQKKDITSWTKQHASIRILDGVEINSLAENTHKGLCGIWRKIVIKQGKIRIRCSVEVRGIKLAPRLGAKHYEGGKFQLHMRSKGKSIYRGAKIKFGTFKWESVSFTMDVPENTKAISISLGFQNSTGTIAFRKLKLEQVDKQISLAPVANMGFSDDVAKDGKGGWSDQGRDNDARNFDHKKGIYANVPFRITDPATNSGKAILVMRSHHFPKGAEQVKLKLKRPTKGKYLYLLHTLCWGRPGTIGQIDVVASDGKTQQIDIVGNRDVADWWKIKRLTNGRPGATWTTSGGNDVGLYVSRFPLSVAPDKLIFRSANSESIWLVAGVTISDNLYEPVKRADFVLKANDKWRPLQRTASPRVIPGSALDLSRLSKLPLGRIIVNSKGHLALKEIPNRPIRFFCGSASIWYTSSFPTLSGRRGVAESNFDTHEKIDAFVDELHRQGYNMFRIHCTNTLVGEMEGGKIKLNSKRLDMIDYFIAKLKEKHIYVILDLLSKHVGFTGELPWGYKPDLDYNLSIYFDSKVRAHCEGGMRQLLTHINPYTKLSLIDDPVIAVITGWNEQEFSFIKRHEWEVGVQAWRKFLETTYDNIVKLNSAWQSTYPDFSAIEPFNPKQISAPDRRGVDLDKFIAACERELLTWYVKTLRTWGYKGLFTNYDMTKSLHYVAIRDEDEIDLVTIHNYHAHWTGEGLNQQNQGSIISGASQLFRGCAGTRIAGKPIIVSEYGAPFWNKYRYEEAFAFTAYAALNNFDGIMRHNHPVSTVNAKRISFESFWDPIAAAQQVQSAFIFLRGDVAPASGGVRIRFSEKAVRDAGFYRDAVSTMQSRLSLITRMEMEPTDSAKKVLSLTSNEVAIPLAGVSGVKNNVAGFSSVVENSKGSFNLGKTISELKKRGIIPAANRSGSWTYFESSTSELLLDTNRKFMRIDTPRFQGMCAPAGTSLSLSQISIDRFTTDANLSVIALKKTETVANASRLLVIYATNALNNKMTFVDESFRVRKEKGGNPTLIRVGAFSLRIRNSNAEKLTVYPIAMNGARRAPIPTRSKNGELIISVDTAKLPDGPAIFFEIVNADISKLAK